MITITSRSRSWLDTPPCTRLNMSNVYQNAPPPTAAEIDRCGTVAAPGPPDACPTRNAPRKVNHEEVRGGHRDDRADPPDPDCVLRRLGWRREQWQERRPDRALDLSLIHISEPTRLR